MIAGLKKARRQAKEHKEARKNRQKLIKSHPAALAEYAVFPGCPNCPAQQFARRQSAERPHFSHWQTHLHCRLAGPAPAPLRPAAPPATQHPHDRFARSAKGSVAVYDVEIVKRLALLLLPFCVVAQDSRLEAIRATVLGIRQYANDHQQQRGAIPQITVAKHELRDWIEARLAGFPRNGDTAALTETFHDALRDAGLFCNNDSDCFPTAFGFLDEIQIQRQGEFLVAETAVGVGIRCGYDYSGYIYQWNGGKWRRIWENEQNDYSAAAYFPQLLHSIQISDPGPDGSRLILTLGTQAGCLTFKDVYYRVWRLGISKPLLDRHDLLYDEGDPPVVGTIQPEDVRIEFAAGGGGYGYPHKAVRHFEMDGAVMKQADPIAPAPRDFVDEWLAAPWTESAGRSESPDLQQWHRRLHRDDDEGDFPDDPIHCANDPELWQIATHLQDQPKHYFLIRWHRPDRFTMQQISDQPLPACR